MTERHAGCDIAPRSVTFLQLLRELRQVLAELELVSHVPAFNYESSGGRDAGESIGGKRPPGGIVYTDDRAPDYPQKSVEHFRRRVATARSNRGALELILADSRDALEAAQRQPAPTGPRFGEQGWKRYVAESDEKASDLARKFGCKRSYIEKVRRLYRDEEAA